MSTGHEWWRHAVIYQVYPRSWADSDGDGVGDLPGITARLPHLVELGVDALWLSPFYVSPQHDAGYDVADYREVDPLFGRLADADALLARAHELGLKVIVDLVPNHTSSEHPWFRAALAAAPGSPERARYLFRDGTGPLGDEPPTDWRSVFGGPAWTQVSPGVRGPDGSVAATGQWYLHLFDVTQPDLDWTNRAVWAEFEDVLRFWIRRGVDGFRVDVAHGLIKDPALPNWQAEHTMASTLDESEPEPEPEHGIVRGIEPGPELSSAARQGTTDCRPGKPPRRQPRTADAPMWDQDGVHEIYRSWRRVVESTQPDPATGYQRDGDVILCAEAWVAPLDRAARYVRPDEMHQSFNFEYLAAAWSAEGLRGCIADSLAANDAVGAPTTWVLSNHDVLRHATRLALPSAKRPGRGPNGIGPDDAQPDPELGLRRGRAATAIMLALPGSAYLYQGEELGLPEHTTLPAELRQDPTWERSEHAEPGRDGCRIPMPWEGDAPACGFNSTGRTWLPQPGTYAELAVDRQRGVEGSTYELYRRLLRLRREHGLGSGSLTWLEAFPDGAPVPAETLAFRIRAEGGRGVLVLANLGEEDVPLPAGEVLVTSGPHPDGVLPPDTTVWLADTAA